MLELFQSKTGIIIMSIIWGLGLSALFRQVCKGRDCILIKAPNPTEVKKKTYKYDGKCYKYSTKTAKCNGSEISA